MSTLTIKVYLRPGYEVRRLELNPKVDTLHSLKEKLKEVHEASPIFDSSAGTIIDFNIQYLDDENEWITATTDEEWKVALKVGAALADVDQRAILRMKCNIVRRPKPVSESPQRFPIDLLFAPQKLINARPEHCQRFLSRACPLIGQSQQSQEKRDPLDLENLINSVLGAFFVGPQEKSQESSKHKREEKQEEVASVEEKRESSHEIQKPDQVDEEAPIIEDAPEEPERQEVSQERETVSEDTKEQDFEYPTQLTSLIAMGFANEDFNKFLLRKNRGDITKTIAQLLEL